MSDYIYKYEVHMHTATSSACGKTPPAKYISEFKRLGYTGMIITDHFYHGNTAIDRGLAWCDFVEQFCRGYEEAKAEGDKQGIKVFFGWEENHDGDEYLIYGPEKQWLKEHPEILHADQAEALGLIHEAGGCIVQAHPFRERGYLSKISLHPFQCDAMEASNFGNPPYQDILAYNFIKKYGKPMTSGTDLHDVKVLENSPCGMLFEKPLESPMDYAQAILKGEGFMPMISEERKRMTPETVNTLPIRLFDEKNKWTEKSLSEIMG